jgi:hypothetical protein
MEKCLVVSIDVDKKYLNLGIGKYDSKWLTNHYGINFNESYWVSEDLKKNECIKICDNKYFLYKDNFKNTLFTKIFYNILCYIKYGHFIDYYMKTSWTIK